MSNDKALALLDKYHDAIQRSPGLRECLAPRIERLERQLKKAAH